MNDTKTRPAPQKSGAGLKPVLSTQPPDAYEKVCLDLCQIIIDPTLQTRTKISPKTVKSYATAMSAGTEFPPVWVALIEGRYLLLDGFHRVAASRTIARRDIEALIVARTISEAKLKAAPVNLTHGLPLTRQEKMKAFLLYIQGGGHKDSRGRFKSYRQIAAELCGVGNKSTIHNWMSQHFPRIASSMGTVSDAPSHTTSGDSSKLRQEAIEKDRLIALEQALETARGLIQVIDPQKLPLALATVRQLEVSLKNRGVESHDF